MVVGNEDVKVDEEGECIQIRLYGEGLFILNGVDTEEYRQKRRRKSLSPDSNKKGKEWRQGRGILCGTGDGNGGNFNGDNSSGS